MHRGTQSQAPRRTQQPGLPPPLLSVHAQQACPLPKHTRVTRRPFVSQRLQAAHKVINDRRHCQGVPSMVHLSHPGRIAHIHALLHTCFMLTCELRSAHFMGAGQQQKYV